MEDLRAKANAELAGAKDLIKRVKQLIRLWQENNIFEGRLITGWQATLALAPQNLYSFNLDKPGFQPQAADQRLDDERVRQIVLPALKSKLAYLSG